MTPEQPGYYAVIFSSRRNARDAGYREMAELMERMASDQPGFLGVESVRSESGAGITVSYWASRQAIAAWKDHVQHRVAQDLGRREWYQSFTIRICRVEESRSWESRATSDAPAAPEQPGPC